MATSNRQENHLNLSYIPQLGTSQPRSGSSTTATSPTEPPSSASGSLKFPMSSGSSLAGLPNGVPRMNSSSPSHEYGNRLYSKRYVTEHPRVTNESKLMSNLQCERDTSSGGSEQPTVGSTYQRWLYTSPRNYPRISQCGWLPSFLAVDSRAIHQPSYHSSGQDQSWNTPITILASSWYRCFQSPIASDLADISPYTVDKPVQAGIAHANEYASIWGQRCKQGFIVVSSTSRIHASATGLCATT